MSQRSIKFFDCDRPILPAGEHRITATQSIVAANGHTHEVFTRTQSFLVEGPLRRLNPSVVHTTHPPAGHQGDYQRTLPHIVLTDSTLPWLRHAGNGQPLSQPGPRTWLALLVFAIDELPPLIRSDIQTLYPESREQGEMCEICVPKVLLPRVLPQLGDIDTFVHVREVSIEEKSVVAGEAAAQRYSVVVASRVPLPNCRQVAHLVSLASMDLSTLDTGSDDLIFTSLFHWEFTSLPDADHNAIASLSALDLVPLALPVRVPTHQDSDELAMAKNMLARGYCGIDHAMRGGLSTVSWYRGPLQSFLHNPSVADAKALFRGSADSMLLYDERVGMFDTSLAAAWQLGRLIALDDAAFIDARLQWRQQIANLPNDPAGDPHASRALEPDTVVAQPWATLKLDVQTPTLLEALERATAFHSDAHATPDYCERYVATWLNELTTLHHVPLQYLVPDPNMVPAESLRFFRLDRDWYLALVSGALRLNDAEMQFVSQQPQWSARLFAPADPLADPDAGVVTGFLLRTHLLTHWQGLELRATTREGGNTTVTPLRQEIVGPSLMLALYPGTLTSVTFVEPTESVAFAVPSGSAYFSRTAAMRYPSADTPASEPDGGATFAQRHMQSSRSVHFALQDHPLSESSL